MYEEAGEDPREVIAFISWINTEIGKCDDDDEEDEASVSHVKAIQNEVEDAIDTDPGGKGTQDASKTQGSPLGAQKTSPAEGAVTEPAKDAGGDKEGVQSRSVAGNE